MELRAELLTDEARDAVADVLGAGTLFAELLPLHLWPPYGRGTDFAGWTRERQEVADANARPIWDRTASSLGGRGGYDTAARALTDLERFLERVEARARPDQDVVVPLEYAVEALKTEAEWAGPETRVAEWLDGDGSTRTRPWWEWNAADGGRGLYIPELFSVVGDGVPARVLADEQTWADALSRAESDLVAPRTRLAPFAALGAALRFQTAVVRTALTRHVVLGAAGPFPVAAAQVPDEDADPFPPGFPGAATTPLADKMAFVRCAHEAMNDEAASATGKSELLECTLARLGWSRDRARTVGIAIGAYNPSPRGRPRPNQQEDDRNQFVDAINALWPWVERQGN